ncbi:alpha-amylase family glycosyl hydrolase [Legionella sp. W05-934-2]|jgi:trehalose synthase|uniref:alpha-amylase family glycosyl hydrolase n=1 Tax=Legionella sp. W05-934-2 TaxID=1198649 RepID=UPI003462C415
MRKAVLGLLILGYLLSASAHEPTDALIQQSMLYQSKKIRQKLAGSHHQWLHSYMKPSVERVLTKNAVWFDAYPDAMIHEEGQTILAFFSQKKLWRLFKYIGIDAIHTGPMQQAGGYESGQLTPSVDGGFDPISLHIDARYGTDSQYRQMTRLAKAYGGMIISDLIPGHTGKGIDFYLALLGFSDYQGLYTLIEIPKRYWAKLPTVETAWHSINLTQPQVEWLSRLDILPGHLQRVLFSMPSQPTTGWDITGEIQGVDGKMHRYAYLHYFKPGQPTLNWLDASFSAQQLISAQIIQAIVLLKADMLRIDANPFLGLERIDNSTQTHSEGTPLAINASNTIAQMIRKWGGYSFQELNLSVEKMKQFMEHGADFSYDFITRPAIEHAVLTGDARLLNTMMQQLIKAHIDVRRLEHGLQNHDEITYELVELTDNPTKRYLYGDKPLSGFSIKQQVIEQMRQKALSKPYNVINNNGLCTTMAGLVATRLDIQDPYHATPAQIAKIQQGMYLLFAFNALLPGIVNISGWDLVGALPLRRNDNSPYQVDSDCRWLNRGSYELFATKKPQATLAKAKALFPPLAQQTKNQLSYVGQIKTLLDFRKRQQLAKAKLVNVLNLGPQISAFVTEYQQQRWLMVFNFSDMPISFHLPPHFQIKGIAFHQQATGQLTKVNALDFVVFKLSV